MVQKTKKFTPAKPRPPRILSWEDLEAFGPEDNDEFIRVRRRLARKYWKASENYRRLALQLDTGGVFTATSESGLQGEYINGTLPRDWNMSERCRALRNGITENKDFPIILIDVEQALPQDGVSESIAHEIGHHLDYLANGSNRNRKPKRSFLSTFHRAGFYTCEDDAGSQSELIAETLGQYLRGTNLPSVLLAEVTLVLGKLRRGHVKIIQKFRRTQIEKNSVAAPGLDKKSVAA
jgi:hypothetical protein